MRKIQSFEVIQHGRTSVEPVLRKGFARTTSHTTGCGLTENEALEQAVWSLEHDGWDVEALKNNPSFRFISGQWIDTKTVAEGNQYWYVTICVKG
jgi:hypothetical protein